MWIASSQGLLAMTERTVMAGLVGDTQASFRGDAEHRTRNLEIPRCAIAHLRSGPSDHPGMTECRNVDCFVARAPRNDGEDRRGRACWGSSSVIPGPCGASKPASPEPL